jgi:diguanylate cyclase (GGDEF)-like protein
MLPLDSEDPDLKRLRDFFKHTDSEIPGDRQSTFNEIIDSLSTKIAAIATQLERTERENQELRSLAFVDTLTQVGNRRSFDSTLKSEWERGLRDQSPVAVIMLDIDHFKLYNDSYGHQSGDDCLQQVGFALRQSVVRPSDVVTRYGGEEFAVVLPNTTTEGAAVVAERIREAIQSLRVEHKASLTSDCITASLGVASIIPTPETLPQHLIEAADQALYQSKEKGRNQVSAADNPKDRLAETIQPQVERLWKVLGKPESLSWSPYRLEKEENQLTLLRTNGEAIARFSAGKSEGAGTLNPQDVDALSAANIRGKLLELASIARQSENRSPER